MGLCFVECSFRAPLAFCGPGYPVCRDGVRSRPAPSARFNLMRFPAPGAAGAVRENSLGASLVCLLAAARR
jgi:hypothetical protein